MNVRYWPLSILANSALMPQVFAWDLRLAYETAPSQAALHACGTVAMQTPAIDMPGLVTVSTGGRLFLRYPEWAGWHRLERAGVFQADNGDVELLIDALH